MHGDFHTNNVLTNAAQTIEGMEICLLDFARSKKLTDPELERVNYLFNEFISIPIILKL